MDEPPLVVFTPHGRKAGSTRTRIYDWIERLALSADIRPFSEGNRAGASEILRRPVASLRRHRYLIGSLVSNEQVVMIHREIDPLTDGHPEERALCRGRCGIVDLDDGLQWDWGDGGGMRRLRPKAPKLVRMVSAADAVVAGNDVIAEWAAPHASRVIVVPTCVDTEAYVRKDAYELHDPPRIGWIGSSTTERHLATVADALLGVHAATGARLTVVSDGLPTLGQLERMIDRVRWSEENAHLLPATWDVGIMPVPDQIAGRSKCAYKILQYGAAALPAIGSPVGLNAEVVALRFAPRGRASWRDSLIDMFRLGPDVRRSLGEAARLAVQAKFSFRRWSPQMKAVLSGDVT